MSAINELSLITTQLNRSFALLILAFGTTGNFINILLFSRRSLRKQPCSVYLIGASIVSLFALYSGLLSRLLHGYGRDISIENSVVCKLRFFTAYWSLTSLAWFLVCASGDRYFMTSPLVHRRNFSHRRIAYRLVFAVSLFSLLAYASVFVCFGIDTLQLSRQCYSMGEICSLVTDIEFLLLYSMLPTALMTIFACLTLRNVKQLGIRAVHINNNRIVPNGSQHFHQGRRQKNQLVPMLLTQIALFVLFTVPVAVSKFFTSLTNLLHNNKSNEQLAYEAFSYNVTVLVTYLNCSVSFYVYTLTGRLFRDELKKVINKLVEKHYVSRTTE